LTYEYVFAMVVCVSHGYPPGDVELFSSSGYQTLILHTSQYTTLISVSDQFLLSFFK